MYQTVWHTSVVFSEPDNTFENNFLFGIRNLDIAACCPPAESRIFHKGSLVSSFRFTGLNKMFLVLI